MQFCGSTHGFKQKELKSSIQAKETKQKIKNAAKSHFKNNDFELFFEHGQWFLSLNWEDSNTNGVRYFSVVDEESGIDGFGFEEI